MTMRMMMTMTAIITMTQPQLAKLCRRRFPYVTVIQAPMNALSRVLVTDNTTSINTPGSRPHIHTDIPKMPIANCNFEVHSINVTLRTDCPQCHRPLSGLYPTVFCGMKLSRSILLTGMTQRHHRNHRRHQHWNHRKRELPTTSR